MSHAGISAAATDDSLRVAARRAMGGDNADELDFGGEVMLPEDARSLASSESAKDRFHPRKPRYVNRVHTGYDWNRYNRTHYDHDNPPPKNVQGYKFNIFYPDLIDPSATPTFRVEPDPRAQDRETVLLRFSAGPPYEDIAFRVVNREWDRSGKRGFKCLFSRGILHLYFMFKRLRYKR